MSDFSTSSVDRFLRDHGFALSGHALSSLSDDDEVGATADASGAAAAAAAAAADDSDERERRQQHSFQSASEEEEPVTPRFTLLDNKDLDQLASDRDGVAQQSEQAAEDTLDRSLVLGVGSGFSAFSGASSAAATDERSRIAQTLHEEGAVAAASALHQRLRSRRGTTASGGAGDVAASSAPPSSSSGSFTSGSRRVLDDELSDALGVTASTPERRSRSGAPDTASARSSRTGAPPIPRASHRALFPPQESESTAPRGSLQLPRPPSPIPRALPSRLRSASAPVVEPLGGSSAAAAVAEDGGWSDLNDKLRKHGLQAIGVETVDVRALHADARGLVALPERESVANLVQDVILQLERKDQIIQDIILESNRNSREQSRVEGNLQTAAKKNEEVQRSLESARNEIVRLQEKLKTSKEETEEQAKKLKQACLNLQQQLKVSEHRVKAKEVLVERMQQKLQQQVDKESLSKSRDRQVFRQLQQRDVKRASARDNQSLEYIGMFEAQREQMQEEIDHLKSQVAALNAELRDKENYIARKAASTAQREMTTWGEESGGVAAASPLASGRRRRGQAVSVASDDMMLERLEAARREQEQAATKLRRREAAMIKKVTEIEQELLSAHEAIGELKEENANLVLEAESRPSIRDYRLCQRRIHQLERQVSESKLALEEATDLHELRKYMGTKELIERDRLNHRLHLNRLNTLPRETTLEVVKEVCRVLNLTDITLITPSLEKLCRVVAAVPRMEQFIRDVCGFVFLSAQDGSGVQVGVERHSGFELERVLPTLQRWSAERQKLHALEEFKAAVVSELCKRSIGPSVLAGESEGGGTVSQTFSLSRAVHIVAELVDLEKNVVHHREIYSQAATEIERRPSVLVNQIVRHFSHLFHVKSVDGVLPKINEIYLFVNEMENFLNVIRSILRLKTQTSVTVCLNAIRDKLEGDDQSPAREQRENRPMNGPRSREPNFVVEKSPRTGGTAVDGASGITGVRQVREMTILIRELKRELGAASMHEILPRTKRLMELLSLSIHNNSFKDEEDDD